MKKRVPSGMDWKDKAQVAAYMKRYGATYDRKKAKPRKPHDRKAYAREYRAKNRTEIDAYQKAYRQKNKSRLQAHKTAWRRRNRELTNAINRAYRRKNPGKQRAWTILSRYGLTPEQFKALGEHCEICRIQTVIGKVSKGQRNQRCVDHHHGTDEVRGLLCSRCNFAIGLLDESPDRLRAAAAYLEQHEQRQQRAS